MRAEYDHRNNRVVSIEMDDGRVVSTNTPRVLGAPTQWVGVDVVYPDGYDARFNRLLRAENVMYTYNERGNRVTVTYPDADFSPDAIRAQLLLMVNVAAMTRLRDTDWYVVRHAETGAAIPDDISVQRQQTRDRASAYEAEIAALDPSELPTFEFSFDPSLPSQMPARAAGPETVPNGDGAQWVTSATQPGEEGEPVRPADEEERAMNTEINPLDPEMTRGTVSGVYPNNPSTGLPWRVGNYKDLEDGRE